MDQRIEIVVGTEFKNMEECRTRCLEYASRENFEYSVRWTDKHSYGIKCKAETCQWKLQASIPKGGARVIVRTMGPEHTCAGIFNAKRPQGPANMLVRRIVDKLRDQPKYRASDLRKDFQREYGLKVPYLRAWEAREQARLL